jgi:hypothetical protein
MHEAKYAMHTWKGCTITITIVDPCALSAEFHHFILRFNKTSSSLGHCKSRNLPILLSINQCLFVLLVKFHQKKKLKIENLKEKWFWRFLVVRDPQKRIFKFVKFIYLVSHCVVKNIEEWLNIWNVFLVYSQIWLNLFRDDPDFFYIVLWMIAPLATNTTHAALGCLGYWSLIFVLVVVSSSAIRFSSWLPKWWWKPAKHQ